MFRLIKLELSQKRLGAYMLATLAISAVLLGFTYLFAFLPSLPTDNELEEMILGVVAVLFGNYENIVAIISILGMFCFGILGATALSRLVLSDYMGKRANLLFAYPIQRDRLFLSKVVIVFGFTILAMLMTFVLVFGIFFMTESAFPLVSTGVLSASLITSTFRTILIFSVLSGSIGLISLWFGFKRKSIQATLTPSYILAAVCSNLLGVPMLLGSVTIFLQGGIAFAALVIGIIATVHLSHDVKWMEAEIVI